MARHEGAVRRAAGAVHPGGRGGSNRGPGGTGQDVVGTERALGGDLDAREALVNLYRSLEDTDPTLTQTLSAFVECGGSLEATARALFVHPNTVRYRLRRVSDLSGFVSSDPRDRWALSLALAFGRLDAAAPAERSL